MIAEFAWSKTALGPIEAWDVSFKKLVQTMLNGPLPQFIAWGEEQLVVYNDALIPILGSAKHPRVLGARFELVWAEIWPFLKPLLDTVARGESHYFADTPFTIERDGVLGKGFFSFSHVPLYDDDDRFGGILCTVLETTESVRASRETSRVKEELSGVLESMDEAYFSLDKGWIITSVNHAHEIASQMKREDQIGKNFLDVFLSGDEAKGTKYWSAYHKAMSERIPVSFEDYYEPLDLWTQVHAYPKSDGGLAVFFKNVSQMKKHERELTEAKAVAELANETKSAFLANMSHEIRTPLGAIMGFADLIAHSRTSRGEIDNYVAIIKRNSAQLLRIIDDILDLSKVEAGRLDIEQLSFSLPDVLSDISSLLGLRARENSIQFEMRAETPLPDFIISDATRLRQILINVVGNAIKFTEKGGVELRASFRDGLLILKVTDSGRGISPEQSQKLFQAFTQADASTNRKYGGTGLGLVLTRSLCRAMGGDFYLQESELGRGSTFVASIRVEVAPEAQQVGNFKIRFSTSQAMPEGDAGALSGMKILLVEDSPDNQTLIQIILSKAGATVDIANDGREGVEMATRGEYEVVLMDVQMPHMDGLEAMGILRRRGFQRPVIALTAHAMKEQRAQSLKAGFSHFMSKPIQKKPLLDLLKAIHTGGPIPASRSGEHAAVRVADAVAEPEAPQRVFLIEDDPDMQSLMVSLLEESGYAVSVATTGEEAMDYFSKNPLPRLIVADLTLPQMSGEEVVRRLREHPERARAKVIIASGWDNLAARVKAVGADGFIRKPVDLQQFLAVVASAMSTRGAPME